MLSDLGPVRAALTGLGQRLESGFLGLREDRGELSGWVDSANWLAACAYLKNEEGYRRLSDLTAVDYLDRAPRFDVQVILTNPEQATTLRLKTMVGGECPQLDSLVSLWPGANWYEREVYDLFGVDFRGHPTLRRLLLPVDYQGHPLRKDYPVTGPPTSVFR